MTSSFDSPNYMPGLGIHNTIGTIVYNKTGEYPQFNSYSAIESIDDYNNNVDFSNMDKPSWEELRTWYDEMQSKITITDGELLFSHKPDHISDTIIEFEISTDDVTSSNDGLPLFLDFNGINWSGSQYYPWQFRNLL